jgi:hypothetical protein
MIKTACNRKNAKSVGILTSELPKMCCIGNAAPRPTQKFPPKCVILVESPRRRRESLTGPNVALLPDPLHVERRLLSLSGPSCRSGQLFRFVMIHAQNGFEYHDPTC